MSATRASRRARRQGPLNEIGEDDSGTVVLEESKDHCFSIWLGKTYREAFSEFNDSND